MRGERSAFVRRYLLAFMLVACATPASADDRSGERADRLVLDTAAHTLRLYNGKRLLHTYTVGLGSARGGKEKQGDERTPLGRYRLFKGRPSKYHRFLPVSYPNTRDAQRGLKRGLITRAQYRAIAEAERAGRMPPQNTALGGAIGIHGIGQSVSWLPRSLQPLHRLMDGTLGCILLTDDEVKDLERRYKPGAELLIVDDQSSGPSSR